MLYFLQGFTQCVKTLYFIKCDGGDLLETNHMARLTTYH